MKPFQAYGITLELMQLEHLELIRCWRNHPDVRQQMLSQGIIDREHHRHWFEQQKHQKNQLHVISYFRGQPVAYCNLKTPEHTTLTQHQRPLSGLYMAPETFRQSMLAFLPALALHTLAFEHLHCLSLEAYVLTQNKAALRFNYTLGYALREEAVQNKKYRHMQLLPHAHRQAHWRFRRFTQEYA